MLHLRSIRGITAATATATVTTATASVAAAAACHPTRVTLSLSLPLSLSVSPLCPIQQSGANIATQTRSLYTRSTVHMSDSNSSGKSNGVGGCKPSVDYKPFLTAVNTRRQPSAIRSLQPLVALPGMISLGGGNPNPSLFPFKGLSLDLADGNTISFTQQELSTALQYSPTPGLPALQQKLKDMLMKEHQPQMDESTWSVSVTNGSTDGLFKAFDMLVESGDNILVESPTYSGTLAALRPIQPNLLEVPCDGEGIIPDKLESMLNTANMFTGRSRARILYVIPNGQNPGGSTLTLERKKRIYAMACKYNLLILEDDPYAYITYGAEEAPAPGSAAESSWVRPRIPSFFSLDTEGRVLRFDSFSKVASSGMRLGMVSGPRELIQRIDLMSQASNLHVCGVAQQMMLKLLHHWGDAGWESHVKQVALFYARRRDTFIRLAHKHLDGLAQFSVPTAGMFVWFHLKCGVKDSKKLVEGKAVDAKVLLVPGQAFMPNDHASNCVRAAFSVATEQEMDTALQRFATLLRDEQKANQK